MAEQVKHLGIGEMLVQRGSLVRARVQSESEYYVLFSLHTVRAQKFML